MDDSRDPIEGLQYQPPSDEAFGDAEFLASPALTDLALELIERHDSLSFINEYNIAVCWKREGGATKGNVTLGKCVKPSGLTAFFCGQDWVIWLAADHAKELGLSSRQVEGLLFHELNHCALKGDPEKGLSPAIKGHDIEEFRSVVEEYGLFLSDLVMMAPVMARQLALFEGGDAGPGGPLVAEG